MKAKSATFITSAAGKGGFAAPDLPEFAFAGRSNVGKSSLLNTLVGVPRLAKTSNTPGRTRLINWFRVEPAKGPPVAFVDLPGYGYAKVPKNMRSGWKELIESYLSDREVLRAVFVLIDARRAPTAEERDLLLWLDAARVPALVVLTKVDKLPKSKRRPAGAAVKKSLGLSRSPILTSAENKDGLAELWSYIIRNARPS